MRNLVPTDEDLNAYIDGELSPHDRARVAHAVAADPGLADRVASLAKLKSVVTGLADERSITLRDLTIASPRRRHPAVGIAASVLIFAVIAGIAALGYWGWQETKTDAWIAQAKIRHLAWIHEHREVAASDNAAALVHATMRRLEIPATIPDMSNAKLTLRDIANFEGAGPDTPRSVQLRYTGRRGCRVSLWISHGTSPFSTALSEADDSRSRGFYWRVGDVSYALFATGMDFRRLTLLARNVYEATRENRSPPERRQRELRVATDTAVPCRA